MKRAVLPLLLWCAAAQAKSEKPGSQVNPEAFRVAQPKPSGKLTFKSPKVKKLKLKNGLPVWLVERHDLPLVSVEMIVDAGNRHDDDTAGLASMVAGMLDEGTTTRSALEIADQAESLGAQLAAGAGPDAAYVSLSALSEALDPSLALMADVLENPKFDDKEFERVRNDRLTDVLQIKDSPRRVVGQLVYAERWGATPYGLPDVGTEASLRRMTTSQLRSFYQATYRPDTSSLVVVGDVSEKTIMPLLDKYFGAWPFGNTKLGGALMPEVTQPASTAPPPIELYDRPGAPQTELRIVGRGISRGDKDYAAVEVMNNVFGGNFSSRLNMNLREKHGYTYGAYSRMGYRVQGGIFVAGGGIRANVTVEALRELEAEVASMVTTPATPEELALAKNSITLSMAGLFQTNGGTAGTLGDLVTYGLPANDYDSLVTRVARITAKDVTRVAGQLLQPMAHMTVVAVGDRKTLEPALAPLGPVHVIDQATWDKLFP